MNELNIKTSNESYFDYCERTEQMSIEWGKDVWDYLVPQLNNWIDTAHLCESDSSYYREKLIEIGKMLGEKVYICDDGTKSQDVLIEKIKEVLEKVIHQNKEVKEEENIWRKLFGVEHNTEIDRECFFYSLVALLLFFGVIGVLIYKGGCA